jgi:hypothetical protein
VYGEHEDQNSSSNPLHGEGQELALNIMAERDLRMLQSALVRGWKVPPERLNAYFAQLDEVMRNPTNYFSADEQDKLANFIGVACRIVSLEVDRKERNMLKLHSNLIKLLTGDKVAQVLETFGQLRKDAKGKELEFDFEGFASLQRNADKLPGGGK